MALGAVTELEIFDAVRRKLVAVGGWFALESVAYHFGRRAPNAVEPPYVVIAVDEQDDGDVESDGAIAQRFAVEIAVRCVGPDGAEAATALLVQCDPRWGATSHGVNITDTDKAVCAVMPKRGGLKLIEPLKGGEDQYAATRRWEIWTAAHIGV